MRDRYVTMLALLLAIFVGIAATAKAVEVASAGLAGLAAVMIVFPLLAGAVTIGIGILTIAGAARMIRGGGDR